MNLYRKRRLSIALVGCVLFIGAALLTSCGSFSTGDQSSDRAAEPEVSADETSALETDISEPTATSAPVPEVTIELDSNADDAPDSEASPTSPGDSTSTDRDDTPVVDSEPAIGEIIFALGITDDYEPLAPGFLFTQGITEVHVIFDYSGMSTAYTWERVWYLNEKKISRSSDPWTGPETGVFDYVIDNGGKPLPAGDWILELYVEEKLHSLGVFIIEESP